MLRNFLLDLDYVNSFASQKTSIVHIKCGDKDTQKNWDAAKIKEMLDLVTLRPPGQLFVSTRYDVSISPVNLDLNQMFEAKKFEQVNKDILDFMGLPVVFVPSRGGDLNNSTVVISLKPFEQSIYNDRRIFEEFLIAYCEEVNRRNGFSDLPIVLYNRINIRGDEQLLKELQFLRESGVLSFRQTCLDFDYEYDQVEEEKKNDWENRNWQAQTYENSQGSSPVLDKTQEQKKELLEVGKQEQNQNNDGSSNLNLPKNSKTQKKQKLEQED
jgi:hypothetical protein